MMVVSRPFVTLAGLLMGGIVAGRFFRLELSYLLFALAAALPFAFLETDAVGGIGGDGFRAGRNAVCGEISRRVGG